MRPLLVITLGVIVSTLGCSVRVAEVPDERPFVAVTFYYESMRETSPAPVVPTDGCVDGCGCNGTGEERSGDGLAVVGCRCPETCSCKANKAAPEPIVEPDPPLVKIEPSEPTLAVIRMPGPRWTFEGLGTNPPPAMKAEHLASDHGLVTTGMTSSEMSDLHDNAHNYGDSKAYGVPGMTVMKQSSSSCPGGNCPTPSSGGTVIRRGLFGRRR